MYTDKFGRTQASEFLFLYIRGTEANLKMVPIYRVPISRLVLYFCRNLRWSLILRYSPLQKARLRVCVEILKGLIPHCGTPQIPSTPKDV